MDPRGFVGAVLAPHHAKDAQFGNGRFPAAEKLLDFFVLIEREAVLPDRLRRESRGQGGRHGGTSIVAFCAATGTGPCVGRKAHFRDILLRFWRMKSIIVGTAGHIDHGKTALVKALTGIDADRLQEEKRRGITIDLGFAHLELPGPAGELLRFGFVDVPGHERFVRNMLAGVGGIDVVLLVIAADEGIKPQTREHFDICRMLAIPRGITVLTKSDTVDKDTLEVVRLEVDEFLRGSFLENSPIITVSAL